MARIQSCRRVAATVAAIVLTVSCKAGSTPTQPLAPVDTPPNVQPGLKIGGFEGYPDFILSSSEITLTATVVGADGSATDCTRDAVWTSSHPDVAEIRVTAEGVTIAAHELSGSFTLSARCGTQTAERPVTIGKYRLHGTVTSGGTPLAGARVMANGTAVIAAAGSYEILLPNSRPFLQVAYPGFEPIGTPFDWNKRAEQQIDISLTPVPGIIARRSGTLVKYGAPDKLTFTTGRPGVLRVLGYWYAPGGSGVDRDLYTTLRCNGRLVHEGETGDGWGTGITVAADSGCRYDFELRNGTSLQSLPYEITVSVQ